jgi:hypothetical protein
MHLLVPTMDSVLVEFSPDGRVRFEDEGWCQPNLQETRAIIHAAQQEIDALGELIAAVESAGGPRRTNTS